MTTPSDLITARAASRQLGISTQRIYQLIDAGKIPVYPGERGKMVSLADVEARRALLASMPVRPEYVP